jgi:hypothetical protein
VGGRPARGLVPDVLDQPTGDVVGGRRQVLGLEADVKLLEEYHDHPSIRRLVVSGHQVITV